MFKVFKLSKLNVVFISSVCWGIAGWTLVCSPNADGRIGEVIGYSGNPLCTLAFIEGPCSHFNESGGTLLCFHTNPPPAQDEGGGSGVPGLPIEIGFQNVECEGDCSGDFCGGDNRKSIAAGTVNITNNSVDGQIGCGNKWVGVPDTCSVKMREIEYHGNTYYRFFCECEEIETGDTCYADATFPLEPVPDCDTNGPA